MDVLRRTVLALLVIVAAVPLRYVPAPPPAIAVKLLPAAATGAAAPAPVRLLRRAARDADDDTDWTELALLDGAVLRQRDGGKTLLIGVDAAASTSTIVRVTAAGTIDASFGGGAGFVDVDGVPAWGAAVAIGADDRITLAVARPRAPAFVVLRLDRDGAADATFGDGGATTLPDGVFASAISVDAEGRVTVGAWSAEPGAQSWRFVRLDAAGHVRGRVTIPACRGVEAGIERLRLLPDGRIVADGWCSSAGGAVHATQLTLPADADATADVAP